MKTLTLSLFLAIALSAGAAMQKDDDYRAGQRDIDAGRWTQAVDKFGQVARKGGSETDAALYWKAYAENKAGRSQQALATLRQLSGDHPQSEWIDDAKALEVEIRGGSGAGEDEELKLYALNGLMGSDPEKAVPLLQKFLRGNHSPRLKAQALFVLSQSDTPEGHRTLVEVARGAAHPELQLQAVEYLGTAGGDEAMRALDEIYRSAARAEVKEAVLHAYHIDDRTGRILAIARDGKDPLQEEAIQLLGSMEAHQELRQLYQSEPPALRLRIVEALGIAGDVETLAGIARQEQNPAVRRQAIQGLGMSEAPEAAKTLRSLYGSTADLPTRKAILEAFMIQDNARALIEIFNAEKDREVRREIVQHLANMDSDEAEKFLARIYEN